MEKSYHLEVKEQDVKTQKIKTAKRQNYRKQHVKNVISQDSIKSKDKKSNARSKKSYKWNSEQSKWIEVKMENAKQKDETNRNLSDEK